MAVYCSKQTGEDSYKTNNHKPEIPNKPLVGGLALNCFSSAASLCFVKDATLISRAAVTDDLLQDSPTQTHDAKPTMIFDYFKNQ